MVDFFEFILHFAWGVSVSYPSKSLSIFFCSDNTPLLLHRFPSRIQYYFRCVLLWTAYVRDALARGILCILEQRSVCFGGRIVWSVESARVVLGSVFNDLLSFSAHECVCKQSTTVPLSGVCTVHRRAMKATTGDESMYIARAIVGGK